MTFGREELGTPRGIERAVTVRVASVFIGAMLFALCGCGGGSPAAPAPSPTPTPSFQETSFQTGTVGPVAPTPLSLGFPGSLSGTIIFPPATVTASIIVTLSNFAMTGFPAVQDDARLVRSLGVSVSVLGYITATSNATTHFGSSIGAFVSMPGVTVVSGNRYLLFYDPANPAAGWNAISGAGSPSTGVIEGENKGAITLQQGVTYDLALVATQGTLPVLPAP